MSPVLIPGRCVVIESRSPFTIMTLTFFIVVLASYHIFIPFFFLLFPNLYLYFDPL